MSLTQNSLIPPSLHSRMLAGAMLFGHAENADQSRKTDEGRKALSILSTFEDYNAKLGEYHHQCLLCCSLCNLRGRPVGSYSMKRCSLNLAVQTSSLDFSLPLPIKSEAKIDGFCSNSSFPEVGKTAEERKREGGRGCKIAKEKQGESDRMEN